MVDWILLRVRNRILHREEPQPRPVFFTAEEVERMNKTEGSYQWGGGNGKESDTY